MNEEIISWDKFISTQLSKNKSFEDLCYQLAVSVYGELGKFTRVDDSGGGDGVEFYLTLNNGDEWGWQAKFFPDKRLNSSRKKQIKKSLHTSHNTHPRLKKWFLCLIGDLTVDEDTWFKKTLSTLTYDGVPVLPKEHNIELEIWGYSEIQTLLIKRPDINNYFFSDKLFTWDWFSDRYRLVKESNPIKSKYVDQLHLNLIPNNTVPRLLGGIHLQSLLEIAIQTYDTRIPRSGYLEEINVLKECIDKFKYNEKSTDLLTLIGNQYFSYEEVAACIREIKSFADTGDFYLKSAKIVPIMSNVYEKLSKYTSEYKRYSVNLKQIIVNENFSEAEKDREIFIKAIFSPLTILTLALDLLRDSIKLFDLLNQSELHITGAAGMGKTHAAVSIAEKQFVSDQPALLILGSRLNGQTLSEAIKNALDIPISWSWANALGALNIAAKQYNCRIPIIIDGLNESPHWRELWKDHLESFIKEIKDSYKNLVIITTYRSTYEHEIFPANYFNENKKVKLTLFGFGSWTSQAINKYLSFYKIRSNDVSHMLKHFDHPLYLRIFCEATNRERKEIVTVTFKNESLFEVFDMYLKSCNENICNLLNKPLRLNKDFLKGKLNQIAQEIWHNKARGIPHDRKILEDNEIIAFEEEGVLTYRELNQDSNTEEIYFSYDALAGYVIARYIIEQYKEKSQCVDFIQSSEFLSTLTAEKQHHPFSNDILKFLLILFFKEKDIFVCDFLDNNAVKRSTIESIFEMESSQIKKYQPKIEKFLRKEFSDNRNCDVIFSKILTNEEDPDHPFNFDFWSELIKSISITTRDLLWTEYIRKEDELFTEHVNEFENCCKDAKKISIGIHCNAKKTMWILTSTIRGLRDLATRSLYYYSCRYHKEFLELLEYSLSINDPYVIERMFAVAYGLSMAIYNSLSDNDFRANWLNRYALLAFDTFFSKEATHSTTHILTRDYAKRIIDISLKLSPNLFDDDEKILFTYPLSTYIHKEWGKSDERDINVSIGGASPIHRDFMNYTVGSLIHGRENYDFNHPDYKEILSNIYWRIYELGYSVKDFGSIDNEIYTNAAYRQSDYIIERYGKKYSWIAFYEMAGYRSDLSLLKDYLGNELIRIYDADIDPSFPVKKRTYTSLIFVEQYDLLGLTETDFNKWLQNSQDLEAVRDLLSISYSFDQQEIDEWTLLNLSLTQKSSSKRDTYIQLNAICVNQIDLKKIQELTNVHSDYEFQHITIPNTNYVFEGEMPWCELMPLNGTEDLKLVYNHRAIKDKVKRIEIFKDGQWQVVTSELDLKEVSNQKDPVIVVRDLDKEGKNLAELLLQHVSQDSYETHVEVLTKLANEGGYRFQESFVESEKKVCDELTIVIDTLVLQNQWSSLTSIANPAGETIIPSKEICNYLGLRLISQSSDLVDVNQKLASTSFNYSKDNLNATFTYIRKDLLNKYLAGMNKHLIWLQWSEKRHFSKGLDKILDSENQQTYKVFCKVYL